MTQSREDYLKGVSKEYGIDPYIVSSIAEILGEDEDYDGLITTLEDNYDYLHDDEWYLGTATDISCQRNYLKIIQNKIKGN